MQIDYRVKARDADGKRRTVRANIVNTGRSLPVADLAGFEVLDGAL